jgi:cyclophilin family peptidyl-prolyl cis-trans isomerase/Tol biopolymer transport system component
MVIGALALLGAAALAAGKVLPEFPTVLGFNAIGMAPVQPVAEITGATLKTDGATVTVSLGAHTFSFTLDKTSATLDGAAITLPAAPFSYAGISYAPLRSLLLALGGTVAPGADPTTLDVSLPGFPVLHAELVNQTEKPQDLQKKNTELFLVNTADGAVQQLTYALTDVSFEQFSTDGTTLLYNRDNLESTDIYQHVLATPIALNLTATFSKDQVVSGCPTPNPDGTFWFMQVDIKKQQGPDTITIPDICQMKMDGAGYKRLTSGMQPMVSANGKIIAYFTVDKDKKYSVHVINADGTNDHVVAEGRLLALSPDGTEAVYVKLPGAADQGQIVTLAAVNTETGKEIFSAVKAAKVNEGFPCFSPDSKMLTYLQEGGGLWIMNADRGNPKQLYKETLDNSPAKFSPDGTKIAFTRNGNLYLMNVDGSDIKPLSLGLLIRDFAFSPDGAQIAVAGMTFAGMQAAMPRHDTRGQHEPPTQPEIDAAKKAGIQHAIIKTEKGDITVELDGANAPLTVANFVKLTKSSFYNGLTFHRVPGNPPVIQGGDPDGNGGGGPGYSIKLEISAKLKHIAGALAMARSQDPNSAGSQFYITLAATPDLDGGYAVFGKVIKGMDVAKKIVVGDKIISITMK